MFVVRGLLCFKDGGVAELFLQLVVGRLLRAAHVDILLHPGRHSRCMGGSVASYGSQNNSFNVRAEIGIGLMQAILQPLSSSASGYIYVLSLVPSHFVPSGIGVQRPGLGHWGAQGETMLLTVTRDQEALAPGWGRHGERTLPALCCLGISPNWLGHGSFSRGREIIHHSKLFSMSTKSVLVL